GRRLLWSGIQQAASGSLGRFDIRLVERVYAQQISGDRRRILPDDQVCAERSADENLAVMTFRQVELVGIFDEANDLQIGRYGVRFGGERAQDDGEDAGALFCSGLGDVLFDAIRQSLDMGAVGDQTKLVAPRARGRDRCAETQSRIVRLVDGDLQPGD